MSFLSCCEAHFTISSGVDEAARHYNRVYLLRINVRFRATDMDEISQTYKCNKSPKSELFVALVENETFRVIVFHEFFKCNAGLAFNHSDLSDTFFADFHNCDAVFMRV